MTTTPPTEPPPPPAPPTLEQLYAFLTLAVETYYEIEADDEFEYKVELHPADPPMLNVFWKLTEEEDGDWQLLTTLRPR